MKVPEEDLDMGNIPQAVLTNALHSKRREMVEYLMYDLPEQVDAKLYEYSQSALEDVFSQLWCHVPTKNDNNAYSILAGFTMGLNGPHMRAEDYERLKPPGDADDFYELELYSDHNGDISQLLMMANTKFHKLYGDQIDRPDVYFSNDGNRREMTIYTDQGNTALTIWWCCHDERYPDWRDWLHSINPFTRPSNYSKSEIHKLAKFVLSKTVLV